MVEELKIPKRLLQVGDVVFTQRDAHVVRFVRVSGRGTSLVLEPPLEIKSAKKLLEVLR